MNRQIKYGALISYVALFINIIIGLVYTPWMIRSIGKADYGLYTLAMSVISLFVFDFGLSSAVTRFVSKYLAEGRQDKANHLIGVTYKLYVAASMVIFVVLVGMFFFIPQIYKGLTPEELEKFKVLYVIAACYSVLSFPFIPLDGIISANEKFIQLKLCNLAHKLFIVVAMSACLLLGYGLYALVIVNAVAGFATIVLKLLIVKKNTQMQTAWSFWDKDMFNAVVGFSVWVTVSALAQRLVLNICPSILGVVANSQAIAVFGISMTIEGYVYTFASAINGLFLPKVTHLNTNGENNSILKLMIKVGRIQYYIIGAIFFGFICFGRNFINVWVGPDYSEVYLCSIMMIAPSFISLAQEIGNTTVIVKGEVRKSAYISLVKAVINILLAFPLTYYFGVYGMAFSIFISYSFSTALYNCMYNHILGLNINIFFRESLFNIAFPMIVAVAFAYLPNLLLNDYGWGHFIVKFAIFSLVYGFVIYNFAMNNEERNIFIGPFKKISPKITKH